MKKISIWATKGGTGKSTVCANLGLALKNKGLRIGFLDVDCTGSNLPTALGILEPFPYVGLDTTREKMIAVEVNGYEIFSLSFRFGTRAALMWQGNEQKIKAFGQEFEMRGTGTYQLVKQMLTNVEFSNDLDYLLYDLPPTSGDITLSLFENISDIFGAILVCQPTNLAVQDIERTLNMIGVKRIPLLGMVGNMVYAIAPKSREEFCPFLDAGIDLETFCNSRGIPYLTSIPLSPIKELISGIFDNLADKVTKLEPVRIWERSFKQRLEAATAKGIIKGLFKEK
ncbi:Iron-sulfur cluster carrier protein [subsurface metagenome]